MDGFVIIASAMKVGFALLALVAAVYFLRWIDRKNQVSFGRDMLTVIRQTPQATALYFGLRFLGVAILIGMVIG